MDEAIERLERIAALHWQARETARLGEWLLRAAAGFTGRANSALATGDPGMPLDDALAAVTAWYQARGLRPMIAVPLPMSGATPLDTQLTKRRWPLRQAPAYVMTANVAPPPAACAEGTALCVDAEPDDDWLGMYHYRGQQLPPVARDLLLSAERQSFVSIRGTSGGPVAIARVSVAGGWAGLTAVEVSPAHRRQGLGTLITSAALAVAARQGITRAFLQVETANAPALALYGRCGFRYSHRYHYRLSPPA